MTYLKRLRNLGLAVAFGAFAFGPVSLAAHESEAPTATSEPEPEEVKAEGEQERDRNHKAGYQRKGSFGGPNSPEAMLEEDDRVKKPALRIPAFDRGMGRWFDWKAGVYEQSGFQISGHYASLYQSLSESTGSEDEAWSGLFRLTTKWELTGRESGNTGSLVFTGDHRHAISESAPAGLANEAGYLGVTGTLFGDFDAAVINLHWTQALWGGDAGLIIGRYDPTDYMNVLGYANPWTTFQNLAILLDASVAFPDASWGIGGGSWFNDSWWALASVNDANGVATDELEFFAGGGEFFSQASFGWSPSKEDRYFKSVNATFWHVDARDHLQLEESQGVGLNANWTWDQQWMLFARAGFSDGSAPIYNSAVTAGFIRYFAGRSDLVGLAVNWGDPPAESLPEQTTVEGFYRFQLAQNLAITPSFQYLLDPAFDQDDDEVWVVGLRLRMTY